MFLYNWLDRFLSTFDLWARHVVGVFRKRVVKGGGTTGVLDRRASDERGKTGNRPRQGTDYDREPITAQGHGPTNTENASRERYRWTQPTNMYL